MAKFGNEDSGRLPTTRSIDAAGSPDAIKKKPSTADKESQGIQDYRKKKKDALEGKNAQKVKGSEPESEKGRSSSSSKKGGDSTSSRSNSPRSEEGRGSSIGKKGGGGSTSGSRSGSQTLQSGQTTVQFSSGDGASMATALGSLLALFSSSASLIRAETGAILTVSNQSTLTNLRYVFQASPPQTSSLSGGGGKNTGNVGLSSDQVVSVDIKFNPGEEGGASSRGATSSENVLSSLLSGAKSIGTGTTAEQGGESTSPVIVEALTGEPLIVINASNTFFPTNTQFTFINSTSANSSTFPYSGVIGKYFSILGESTSSSYTYKILSPVVLSPDTPPSTSAGITINSSGATEVSIATANQTLTSSGPGLTLAANGDIFVNIANPISVLVEATGSNIALPVRINAGPGQSVTNDSHYPATMLGVINSSNSQFESTVFTDGTTDGSQGKTTIVGSAMGITVNSGGGISYYSATSSADTNPSFTMPSSGGSYTYVFPSNTIFRHIGQSLDPTSASPVPTQATYGNFSTYAPSGSTTNVESSIALPQAPSSYNLTFGGNVLDVFGTKYGEGDILNITLSPATSVPAPGPGLPAPAPLPANTITMGGNTLAGFGESYGDLQTLTITASSSDSAATVGATNIVVNGNTLAVDKNIGSILYPHFQTLDMENFKGTPAGAPSNVHISFSPSILEGNTGGDTFYGDIQNLISPTSSSQSYTGFVSPVTVTTTTNGQVVTTTTDGNNNSIAWGNDIYGQENVAGSSPQAPDTYNFTLLQDATGKAPVMPGNILFTNFSIATDKLIFEITPSLFRALEGAAPNTPHDKTINAADLNALVTFTPLDLSTLSTLQTQYLSQRFPGQTLKGVTINFDPLDKGGSLTLIESDSDTTSLLGKDGGFNDIKNLSFVITNFDETAPVTALPTTTASTPTQTPPYLYGEGPVVNLGVSSTQTVGPYFNELDNFFANSLLATYRVSGAGVTSAQTPLSPPGDLTYPAENPGTTIYTIGPGVTIDQYGTIDVTATATAPILIPLTITATDQNGNTVTMPSTLFGFLDAPITTSTVDNATITGVSPSISISNILIGAAGSTLVGEFSIGPNYSLGLSASGIAYTNAGLTPNPNLYGSNLIVSTAGGSTAYGDFETVNITAQGTGGLDAATAPASPAGAITGSTFEFAANAFDVTNGTVYGVDKAFNVTAQGGANDTLTITNPIVTSGGGSSGGNGNGNGGGTTSSTPLSLTDSGQFGGSTVADGNKVDFDAQTIYGSGLIYGDGQTLNLSATAGTGSMYIDTTDTSTVPTFQGSLDVSSAIENNTFTFAPVTITVTGDTSATMTSIYPNIENLWVTTQPTFPKITSISETTLPVTTATFSDNSFIFKDVTINAGSASGNIHVYADVNLDNTAAYAYNGFIDPVSVNSSGSNVIITTTDGLNNQITLPNEKITGGPGSTGNTYEFYLGETSNGTLYLRGNADITNFNPSSNSMSGIPSNDKVILNIEANAAKDAFGVTSGLSMGTLATDLNLEASFTHQGTNTIIHFLGGGELTLTSTVADNFNFTSFSNWLSADSNSLVINVLPSPTPAPTLNTTPVFDPVFINTPQPDAFAPFISGANPQSLTYTDTLPPPLDQLLHPGVTIQPDGTLDVNVTNPGSYQINALATNGTTTVPITTHIFAINAPFIDYDTSTTNIINGTPGTSSAFEVMAGTVYGGGGGAAGLTISDTSPIAYASNLIYDMSTVSHTIYGDVASILDTFANNGSIVLGPTYTFGSNLINVNNGGSDSIYGTTQSLTISGAQNAQFIFGNFQTSSGVDIGNTISATGQVYGDLQTLTLGTSTGGSDDNTFLMGGNTITGGAYVNGAATPTNASGASLYAGIGTLEIVGSVAETFVNTVKFSDSTLTGIGSGTTEFYGDIASFGTTDFDTVGVKSAGTFGGQVQVQDESNNPIIFGNDTMNASTAAGATSVFNINLLHTASGNTVTEGNTTINNFGSLTSSGTHNPNMLNLQLSDSVYNDIVNWAATNGVTLTSTDPALPSRGVYEITATNLNDYLSNTAHENITNPTSTSSTISFSDASGPTGDLGSITLNGIGQNIGSLQDLGTNIEITAKGITTIDPAPSPTDVYNVTVPGNTLSSYTQNTHILDVSSLGQVVDFAGEVDLHLSNGLFKALGLSDANTAAQNLQILENNAHTATGGIEVTTSTTGTGANAVTNTTLTFESLSNGTLHTYGSITLHDTNFNPLNPLGNHVLISHS